jgi:hypothetical protein
MSDSWTTPRESRGPEHGNGYQGPYAPNAGSSYEGEPAEGEGELGRAVMVAILGGLVSAAGYLIYKRLPDEQKDRLNGQVRSMVQQRINELRQNFNI